MSSDMQAYLRKLDIQTVQQDLKDHDVRTRNEIVSECLVSAGQQIPEIHKVMYGVRYYVKIRGGRFGDAAQRELALALYLLLESRDQMEDAFPEPEDVDR